MPQCSNPFDQLPEHILEKIFRFLPWRDVVSTRKISKYVCDACSNYLQRSFNKLRADINGGMEKYFHLINISKKLADYTIRNYIKLFSILEGIDCKLEMVNVLKRCIKENDFACVTVFLFIDRSYRVLNEMQKPIISLKNLHLLNMKFEYCFTYYMNYVEKSTINADIPLGIQAIDLLNLIKDISYIIVANYNLKQNTCDVEFNYFLQNSKVVSYLPLINFMDECTSRTIKCNEQDTMIKYLMNLVNVHNKMVLRNLQYEREINTPKRNLPVNIFFIHTRHTTDRKVKDAQNGIVEEVYKSSTRNKEQYNTVKCTVKLQCPINFAPVCIKKQYDLLKNDIELNNGIVRETSMTEAKNTEEKNFHFYLNLNITRFPFKEKYVIIEISDESQLENS